jgi:hypothetical protein
MWAFEFMCDTVHYGTLFFLTLDAMDTLNRRILAIEININLPVAKVVWALKLLEGIHRLLKTIWQNNDNGSARRYL